MQTKTAHYKSPIGLIELSISAKGLSEINIIVCDNLASPPFLSKSPPQTKPPLATADFSTAELKIKAQIFLWFDNYFTKNFSNLKLPKLDINASQKRIDILNQLITINLGDTETYGQIASKTNTGARVVATACSSNKLPLIIPCHRVVNKDTTKKYQYSSGANLKHWLLEHEKTIDNNR